MTSQAEIKIFAETDRFILREVLPKDVEGFFELDSDPEVHKYLGNKPVTNCSGREKLDKLNEVNKSLNFPYETRT